jgi:hypothetical protein
MSDGRVAGSASKGMRHEKLSAERKQRSIKLVRKTDRRRKVRKAKIN